MKDFYYYNITRQKQTTILLIVILLFSSCSSYLIDESSNDSNTKNNNTIKLHCNNNSSREIISNSKPAIKEYRKIINSYKKNISNLSIIEEAVIFSLIQMNFRPDITTPTTRLLLVVKQKGKIYYYDFNSPTNRKEDTPSFLTGLSYLLKKHGSKQSLSSLAKMIDDNPTFVPTVSFELAQFVQQKQEILKKEPSLAKVFFRGDQPLKQGDTIERIPLKKVVNLASKDIPNDFLSSSHLFSYSLENGLKIKCNHDFNLYKHSIFPITNEDSSANSYGIKNDKGDMFMAISFQNMSTITPYKNSFLIKGKYPTASKAICIIQRERSVILTSTKTRDPGQILYNFIELGDKFSTTKNELEIMSYFPRHYFLMNPKRLLFETDRATKEQVDKMISLRFPLYHQRDIGNISAYSYSLDSNLNKSDGFLLDPREDNSIYCQNKN